MEAPLFYIYMWLRVKNWAIKTTVYGLESDINSNNTQIQINEPCFEIKNIPAISGDVTNIIYSNKWW